MPGHGSQVKDLSEAAYLKRRCKRSRGTAERGTKPKGRTIGQEESLLGQRLRPIMVSRTLMGPTNSMTCARGEGMNLKEEKK
jgi:hypothetical protein